MKHRQKYKKLWSFLIGIFCILSFCGTPLGSLPCLAEESAYNSQGESAVNLGSIPEYSGDAYVTINNNVPFFSDLDLTRESFESYSSLDSLGRCGVAYANVCKDTMPTAKRGKIGSIKPTGWHTVKYDNVDGKYLYNRCHLIGYQLTAENANKKNLITGTRYLNTQGMLPFENMVADYVKETNHHVLYRVTPLFKGNNLVATGVLMEAKSVEDNGAGISFNVFCYNVQPGISIDYGTGDSSKSDGSSSTSGKEESDGSSGGAAAATTAPASQAATQPEAQQSENSQTTDATVKVHITNTGSKYHNAGCRTLKSDIEVSLEDAKARGLEPCKICNPPQ